MCNESTIQHGEGSEGKSDIVSREGFGKGTFSGVCMEILKPTQKRHARFYQPRILYHQCLQQLILCRGRASYLVFEFSGWWSVWLQ